MELENLRRNIDDVDRKIIELLAKRFEITKKVGALKAENGINSFSPEREREQFEKFKELSVYFNLPYPVVENIFETIRDQVLINHQKIKSEYEPK